MGFWGFGKKKAEEASEEEKILGGADSGDVVVPDHAKPSKTVSEKPVVFSEKPLFVIQTVYGDEKGLAASGMVQSGVIKKAMVFGSKDKEAKISDIKVGYSSVKEAARGDKATLFLKGKGLAVLRGGDIIEFKEKNTPKKSK